MFHATSPMECDDLGRRFGAHRIAYVPNGVDIPDSLQTDRCDTRRRFGLDDAPFVLFLGRIHPIKRLDLLAAAFRRVRVHHPRARLVIAGPDEGGHRAALAPLFAPLGEAVVWTGGIAAQDKWKLLDACSMLVLCSNSENFGMSAAEAMAASRPVVVTRTCPWPEVESAQTGFWTEQSAASIADAIHSLLANPELAADMGRRGRMLIEQRYSWATAVQRLAAVYERMSTQTRNG